jgi:hypothetical protein
MELKFSSDLDSAKRLDEIMNSYSERDRGSILADKHSLAVTLFLLEHGKIAVTEHTYLYDRSIQSDSKMMEVYSELVRETRWKRFAHTEIEGIRINALRQMRQEGKPFYDGDFMCWREGRVFAHCGNLTLPQLLLYLASHEQAQQFYLFTYPYWTEDHTAKYYRFNLSEAAIKGAGIYRESIWEKMRQASKTSVVFPVFPQREDDPTPPS